MFNNLRRYYNQNRKMIWRIVIIIVFAFLILFLLNTIAKNNNEKEKQEIKAKQLLQENNVKNTTSENKTSSSNESSSKSDKSREKISAIEQFINYCNKQELENAYNMLTDECKEELFSNIELFKNIYYDSTFENKAKEATIDNWSNNTYLVKLAESALATGKFADTKEEQKIDYITVKKVDGEYKLNINSYIGYKKIEKSVKDDGVTIEVLGKHTYSEFEKYVIKVENNSEEDVMLDSLESSSNMYLEDSNSNEYYAYTSELIGGLLNINRGHTKKIEIKFLNAFSSNKDLEKIVFSDYRKGNNQSKIKISL